MADAFTQMSQWLETGKPYDGGGQRRQRNTNNTNNTNTNTKVTRDQQARVMRLLDNTSNDIKRKFQFDAEASWSITNLRVARNFADKLYALVEHDVPIPTITDAMACVGGNTIAFAETFPYVNTIELNESRARMLTNNIKLFGLDNVTNYTGYAQDWLPKLKQDVIFFDPPWGVDYKKHDKMQIWLERDGEKQLFDDIAVAACAWAKFIAMKLPVNYDIDSLVKVMPQEIHREWHGKPNSSVLLVFKCM